MDSLANFDYCMRGFLGQQKIVGGAEVSTQLFVRFKTQFIFFSQMTSHPSHHFTAVRFGHEKNATHSVLTKQQDRKIKIAS